jgi:hypothetical protein
MVGVDLGHRLRDRWLERDAALLIETTSARRRSGVRFSRFSFQDLLEISWRQPQATTGDARPNRSLGQQRPPRGRPAKLAAAGATGHFLGAPDAVISVLTFVTASLFLCTLATAPNAASASRHTPPAAPCAAPILTRSAGRSPCLPVSDCRFDCPPACGTPSVGDTPCGFGARCSQWLISEPSGGCRRGPRFSA